MATAMVTAMATAATGLELAPGQPPASPPPGGDGRQALAAELIQYLRPLLNYARGLLRAREAAGDLWPGAVQAEEIVDRALLDALRRPDEAGEALAGRRLYPWLRRLVLRAVDREVEQLRRRRREVSLEQPVGEQWPREAGYGGPLRLIDLLPDPSAPVPEQVVVSREFQQALAGLLSQLPDAWREPYLLHVRDGLTLAQVAAMEGVSRGEARRRIARAREFLRQRLAEEYADTALPPPTEDLFLLLERIEPAPEHRARLQRRLEEAENEEKEEVVR
jgi:RNA polymerase sigma factor (sigma-70 family)